MKLHLSPHQRWGLHLHNHHHHHYLQNRTISSLSVYCSASSSSSCSSPDDPISSMAMSKLELESCRWLGSNPSSLQPQNGSTQSPSGSSSQASASSSKHSSILRNALQSARLLDPSLSPPWTERAENGIERAIFDFRFLSLFAVVGSLAGSFLCFLKGCVFIVESYAEFYVMCLRGEHTGKMVLRLVEAVDVYLTGTVMLIFGMGLYGLFISNVASNLPPNEDRALKNSALFGMFLLQERPKWMRIASLDELKTKLGHVVVMILLVKMFERSKAVTIATGADLLSYSISIFLTSAALLVLRHLHH